MLTFPRTFPLRIRRATAPSERWPDNHLRCVGGCMYVCVLLLLLLLLLLLFVHTEPAFAIPMYAPRYAPVCKQSTSYPSGRRRTLPPIPPCSKAKAMLLGSHGLRGVPQVMSCFRQGVGILLSVNAYLHPAYPSIP